MDNKHPKNKKKFTKGIKKPTKKAPMRVQKKVHKPNITKSRDFFSDENQNSCHEYCCYDPCKKDLYVLKCVIKDLIKKKCLEIPSDPVNLCQFSGLVYKLWKNCPEEDLQMMSSKGWNVTTEGDIKISTNTGDVDFCDVNGKVKLPANKLDFCGDDSLNLCSLLSIDIPNYLAVCDKPDAFKIGSGGPIQGTNHIAIGHDTLNNIYNLTDRNIAIGSNSLKNLTNGNSNIALGNCAGCEYTDSENNNILIGSFGNTGESNAIRIGNIVPAENRFATFIPTSLISQKKVVLFDLEPIEINQSPFASPPVEPVRLEPTDILGPDGGIIEIRSGPIGPEGNIIVSLPISDELNDYFGPSLNVGNTFEFKIVNNSEKSDFSPTPSAPVKLISLDNTINLIVDYIIPVNDTIIIYGNYEGDDKWTFG
jgi:hypothetical protein